MPTSTVTNVTAAVAASGLLPKDQPVLLMGSAGRDSHCLFDVAVALLGAKHVTVLHVDHGLRAESADEAQQMQDRCALLGARCIVAHAGAKPEGGNTQAWARDRRMALALQAAQDNGIAVVATAHTLTDQVETSLARLATQPGRKALVGMKPSRPLAQGADIALVKPLLGVTRQQTGDYCIEAGIAWCDDPSNLDAKYSRVRMRTEVVPVLAQINPQAEHNIARTINELREEMDALEAIVDAELGENLTVSQERLAALPTALARLVLRALCERSIGAPCPRSTSNLDKVLSLRYKTQTHGAMLDLGNCARIHLDRHGMLSVEYFNLTGPTK